MTTTMRVRRARTLAATMGIALLASLGLVAPAMAADVSLVDPEAKGSLTITKYAGEAGAPHDGTEISQGNLPSAELLAGAEFTVYKVEPYDVTTNAGWQEISTLASMVGENPSIAALEAQGATVNKVDAKTTPAGGLVAFENLALGLYYVAETKAPEGKLPVDPFLVTLPMTLPDGDGWMYDVYVYPKDADGHSKIPMDDKVTSAGDPLDWLVTVKLPGADLESLTITDELVNDLVYTGITVYTDDKATPLTEGVHFDAPVYDAASHKVTIKFTEEGINLLKTKSVVYAEIATTVSEDFTGGAIKNSAGIIQNDGKGEWTTTTPTKESRFDDIDILKVNEKDEKLAGAVFDLYASAPVKGECVAKQGGWDRIMEGSATDVNGEFSFKGLRHSDHANGEGVDESDSSYLCYWLVETQAPEDYQVLAQPVLVELNADTDVQKIVNIERGAGIQLAFTGGPGTLLFIVAGLAMVAGTVVLAIGRKPKKDQAA